MQKTTFRKPLQFVLAFILASFATHIIKAQSAAVMAPKTPEGVAIAQKAVTYTNPAGSYIVDGTNGIDHTGRDGKSQPWQTLGFAVAHAANNATILVKSGTYSLNETLVDKTLTIQRFADDIVWFKGSIDISSGWSQYPSTGTPTHFKRSYAIDLKWATKFNYGCFKEDQTAEEPGLCVIDPANPEAKYRDQLFINGIALTQVMSRNEVVNDNQFYIDYTANVVYLKSNPSGKIVEAVANEKGLQIEAPNVKIRGLGFAHFAEKAIDVNPVSPTGTLVRNVSVEDNTIVWGSLEGLAILGSANHSDPYGNAVVKGNKFHYNGKNGIGGKYQKGILVEDNEFRFNNYQHFNKKWSAAGAKLVVAWNAHVRNNVFADNDADGLWMDVGCNNTKVYNNYFYRNKGFQIFFEISIGTVIAGNVVEGSPSTGIAVANAAQALIYNNTLVGNWKAIVVKDDGRQINTKAKNDAAVDTVYGVHIKNNIIHDIAPNTTSSGYLVESRWACKAGAVMIDTMNYNLYYRPTVGSVKFPDNLFNWHTTAASACQQEFADLAAFRASAAVPNHLEKASLEADAMFADRANHDYRLSAGSPAINAGGILPDSIAVLLGWPTNTRVHMGAKEAISLSYAPTADTYVFEADASGAYGSSTELTCKNAAGYARESFVRFNTSKHIGEIQSAKIRLYGKLSNTATLNVATNIFPMTNITWTESATWNTKPASGTTALGSVTVANTTAQWYELDVTAYINAERSAGRSVVSFALKNATASGSGNYIIFNSSEAAANQPQLVLSSVNDVMMVKAADSFARLETAESKENLMLYPNPTNNLVNIEFMASERQPVRIELKNRMNHTVISLNKEATSGHNDVSLNVEKLPSGFYFVVITKNNKRLSQKLLIAR